MHLGACAVKRFNLIAFQEIDSNKQDTAKRNAISHILWDDLTGNKEESRNLFESTPAKDCMESELVPTSMAKQGYQEPTSTPPAVQRDADSPHSKRRRMLHFPDPTICNERTEPGFVTVEDGGNSFICRSGDIQISNNTSPRLATNEGAYSSPSENIGQVSESWMENCFNEGELQCMSEEMNGEVPFDDQIDISEFCSLQPSESDLEIQHEPIPKTVSTAKKTRCHSATKLVTPVAYPFTLLKPCGVQGDVTLNDINQRILMPQSRLTDRHNDTTSQFVSSPAFSGKAVVALTKIHTEGNGSITIMRTKG